MTRTEVVETVSGRTMADLRAARDRAVADLVELRLDGVEDLDVAGALKDRTRPVIVTLRPTWEGGRFEGAEETRLGRLSEAIRLGAEFVDVEWRADRAALAVPTRTGLVLSHHDFAGIPADLADRVAAMRRESPAVVKVAVTPAGLADCLRLGDVMRMAERHVAIAMGAAGQLTRLCPWLFGSCWTYGGTAAPGQVTARELLECYRVPEASSSTALYGIAGAPLAHSASPAMHNAAFAALGMDAIYVPLETGDGDELLAVADAIGLAGASVTAPLKPAAFARSRVADDVTRQTGAVNTLRRGAAGWEGRNFDVAGFLAPLRRHARPLAGIRAVVLGAGGSARTAAWALKQEGAQVLVSARRAEAAAALAAAIGVGVVVWPPAAGWDLLVNATPVGTWPRVGESPLPRSAVQGALVYDLIYNPRETTLLRWARESGAATIDGLEMLVGQAALQFEWWTGRAAPAAIMEAAAEAFIAGRQQRTA